MRAVGKNRSAARFAGIREKNVFVSVFLVSGAFAGLAGFLEVNGVQHMVVQGFNPLLGAEGIGIAVLGGAHPLGVVLSALLFGALKVGGLLVTQRHPPSRRASSPFSRASSCSTSYYPFISGTG